MSSEELKNIWQSYQTTVDCFKIASRSIKKKEYHLLKKTNFIASVSEEAVELINKSRTHADDHIIISLWAVFERHLFEYLQKESIKILDNNGSEFNKKVQKKLEHEIEYWRIDDILDLFKSFVSSNLIGTAKQIKEYRNWVAHRNPKKGAPPNIPPKTAYDVLTDIVECLEQDPKT